MSDELLLHYRTKRQLDSFIERPSHALILTGPKGVGKQTVAASLAASLLGLPLEKLTTYGYYTLLHPEAQTISIDDIRALQKLLVLRTPSKDQAAIRRVIVMIDAERMPHEAQNAFLKSLEEPPADTCIILTTEGSHGLLPTIYSRAQRIEVLPVDQEAAANFFDASSSDLTRNYALSQGQVGLLSALLSEDSHELKEWVGKAKEILGLPVHERLLQTDTYAKDKQAITMLLHALQRIAHAGLMSAGTQNKRPMVQHWHKVMSSVQFALRGMGANANTKLLLDDLFLNL